MYITRKLIKMGQINIRINRIKADRTCLPHYLLPTRGLCLFVLRLDCKNKIWSHSFYYKFRKLVMDIIRSGCDIFTCHITNGNNTQSGIFMLAVYCLKWMSFRLFSICVSCYNFLVNTINTPK